jgi:hypothetical protein
MYSVVKFICLRDQFGDTLNYKDKFFDVVRYLAYICWHMFQIVHTDHDIMTQFGQTCAS